MIPQSNVKGEFQHVHHDRLVEALQALKPFAYRINKWILTLPRDQLAAEKSLLDTWKETEPKISALLQNLSNLHASIQLHVTIMFQIHEKLKTLAAQVPQSDRFKIHFVCKCGDIHASYNVLKNHRTNEGCDKIHGNFVTNARNPVLYQPHDDAGKKAAHEDAVHTIAWLIRTEMAYFEHDAIKRDMQNGPNPEQMQSYANKLSAELQLHHECSEDCKFLSMLSKDLQQWRSPGFHWKYLELLLKIGETTSTVTHTPHSVRPFTFKRLHHLATTHQPDFRPLTRHLQEMSLDGYPCFWCFSQSHQIIGHYLYELMHHLRDKHQQDYSLLGIANRVGSGALSVNWSHFHAHYARANIRFILVTQWSESLQKLIQTAPQRNLTHKNRDELHNIQKRYNEGAFTSKFSFSDISQCRDALEKILEDLKLIEELSCDIMQLHSGQCAEIFVD